MLFVVIEINGTRKVFLLLFCTLITAESDSKPIVVAIKKVVVAFYSASPVLLIGNRPVVS